MIRCQHCARFTSNNVALRNLDRIESAHGDCSRCGPKVPVRFDAWEDWGWTDEHERAFEDRVFGGVA